MTRPITNEDGVAPRGEISALRRAVLVSVSALLLVVVTLEMSGSGSGALNRLGDAGRPVWLVSKSDEVFQSKVDEQVAHLEKSEEIDEEQATAVRRPSPLRASGAAAWVDVHVRTAELLAPVGSAPALDCALASVFHGAPACLSCFLPRADSHSP